jgi:predicted nucleic acid-binding protein
VILVDTSIWIDHLRASDKSLSNLLNAGRVLDALSDLPQAEVATDKES